jgi:hypothetical protein
LISRGWEVGVKALDPVADGLDTGRVSARLLLSGERKMDVDEKITDGLPVTQAQVSQSVLRIVV